MFVFHFGLGFLFGFLIPYTQSYVVPAQSTLQLTLKNGSFIYILYSIASYALSLVHNRPPFLLNEIIWF
jgi:hypothetical protein